MKKRKALSSIGCWFCLVRFWARRNVINDKIRVPQVYNSKLHLKRLPRHQEKIVAQITGTHKPLPAVSSISTLQMACPSVLSVMHKKVLGFTELWLHASLHENYYYTPLIISNYYPKNIHFILYDKWAKLAPNPQSKQKIKHHFAFKMSAVLEPSRTSPLAFLSATGYYWFIIYLSVHRELGKLSAFSPPNLRTRIQFLSVGMRQMKLLSSHNRSY